MLFSEPVGSKADGIQFFVVYKHYILAGLEIGSCSA